MDFSLKKKSIKAFTLIELLIAIAIVGVLVIVLIVAISPGQKLAESRDLGKKSTVKQLGEAVDKYAVSNNADYPDEGGAWIDALVIANEITAVPSQVGGTTTPKCGPQSKRQNDTWCYDTSGGTPADNPPVIIYARLESNKENSVCTTPKVAYIVYSSARARPGVVCIDTPLTAEGTWSFVE